MTDWRNIVTSGRLKSLCYCWNPGDPCPLVTHPVHVKTEHTLELFRAIRQHEQNGARMPEVLVTASSDKPPPIVLSHYSCSRTTPRMMEELPESVLHWYAQNLCGTHPRAQAVPLGLADECWPHGKVAALEASEQIPRGEKRLAYCCFQIATNRDERSRCWSYFAGQSWATVVQRNTFAEHLAEIRAHPFVISPEGAGVDTHRTWEAMLLGAIPVVRRHAAMNHFADMPIAFCDDWPQVTPAWLEGQRKRISARHWNLDRLSMDYWRERLC